MRPAVPTSTPQATIENTANAQALHAQSTVLREQMTQLRRRSRVQNGILCMGWVLGASCVLLTYPATVVAISTVAGLIGSSLLKLENDDYDVSAATADAAAGGIITLIPTAIIMTAISYCTARNHINFAAMTILSSALAGGMGARMDIYPSETMSDAQALASSALGTLVLLFGYNAFDFIFTLTRQARANTNTDIEAPAATPSHR